MIAGVSMQFNIRVAKSGMVTDLGGRLSGPLIRGLGRDCSAVVESACAFPRVLSIARQHTFHG